MENGTTCNTTATIERHIMIAVDGSGNSKRAVLFVGDFFGCYPDFKVTLLHIILEPAFGYFKSREEQDEWKAKQLADSERMMADYKNILVDSGFAPEKVVTKIDSCQGPAVADCILKEQDTMKCCTVVIGRRGISKKEEFIFGSTSNKILHEGKNCAVLVIE